MSTSPVMGCRCGFPRASAVAFARLTSWTLLLALAGGLASGCSAPENEKDPAHTPAGGRPVNPDPTLEREHASSYVFDPDQLRSYHITFTPEHLDELNRTALEEKYVPAEVTVDGEEMGAVGVRYKGAVSTLRSCFVNGQRRCAKLSHKIDFARYDETKRFHGIKTLNLHSLKSDPAHLRERLAYQLFRQMGVVAPRAVNAKLFVNGQYQGVYAAVEVIDGRFIDYWLEPDDKDGVLYKETWPTKTAVEWYKKRQRTKAGRATPDKVIRFAQGLRDATADQRTKLVADWMGMESMLNMLVVDVAINNWDGPRTFYCPSLAGSCSGNRNFYIYETRTSDSLIYIPWDLDSTFSVFTNHEYLPHWNQRPADCNKNVEIEGNWFKPPGCDPLFQAVAGAGRSRYREAIRAFLAGPFAIEGMHADLDRWADQIDSAVELDTKGPGHRKWRRNVELLKQNLVWLRQKMELRAAGVEPKRYR